MENWKEELQKYVPDLEKFLTSVLLEETNIDIVSSESLDKETVQNNLQKTDIFLYTRDQEYKTDLIVILEKEWYGLLSSIMLGVEEKSHNEITRDLLKKFSSELVDTLKTKMESQGIEPNPDEVEVLVHGQVSKKLFHTEYYYTKMEIEGLADEKVRAAFLFGDPEALEVVEKKEAEEAAKGSETGEENEHSESEKKGSNEQKEETESEGSFEEVISAKHIEFDDFEESTTKYKNGDSHSMEMLKDVDMDVSVELGRIELPLGKVLQLAKGSVVELEKLAGEPVDILVNGHCIAHGEVVVIDEHFGVRISNLVTTHQRIAKMN